MRRFLACACAALMFLPTHAHAQDSTTIQKTFLTRRDLAWTAASAIGELCARDSRAMWIAAPLLYGAVAVPGITRMYLNQHWASDIFAGAFLGTLIGSRVVAYGHSHRTNIDRWLDVSVAPEWSQRAVVTTILRF